jgi:hypothetical protein
LGTSFCSLRPCSVRCSLWQPSALLVVRCSLFHLLAYRLRYSLARRINFLSFPIHALQNGVLLCCLASSVADTKRSFPPNNALRALSYVYPFVSYRVACSCTTSLVISMSSHLYDCQTRSRRAFCSRILTTYKTPVFYVMLYRLL